MHADPHDGVGRLLHGDEKLVRLPQGAVRSLVGHRLHRSGGRGRVRLPVERHDVSGHGRAGRPRARDAAPAPDHRAGALGASDVPVLVSGETGSGKELVARAIHAASPRRDCPFVAVNCGALCDSLLAAELFGVVAGRLHGATTSRPGLFVAAEGGTLLLDEVGDMSPAMQTSLLRVLETSEVSALGATRFRARSTCACSRRATAIRSTSPWSCTCPATIFAIVWRSVRIEVPPLRD